MLSKRYAKIISTVLALILLGSASPSGAQTTPGDPDEDRITQLYSAVFGRAPDPGGLAHYTAYLKEDDKCLGDVAAHFAVSPEFVERYEGLDQDAEFLPELYKTAFDRLPDLEGLLYWIDRDLDRVGYLVEFARIDENVRLTNTTLQPMLPCRPEGIPASWQNTGNGVWVPPVLIAIRWCESTDNYQAANRRSSARGGYQFLTGSWDWYGHAERYGVPRAHLATPAQQDEAALITWQADGTRPWNASRHCWG